jgi:hypothetical protein
MKDPDIPFDYIVTSKKDSYELHIDSLEGYWKDIVYYLSEEGENELKTRIELGDEIEYKSFLLKFLPSLKVSMDYLKLIKSNQINLNKDEFEYLLESYNKSLKFLHKTDSDLNDNDLLFQ